MHKRTIVHRGPHGSDIKNPYSHRRWRRLRAHQLRVEPLCRFCKATGRIVAAEVVDHIERHGGDVNRFWDSTNLQSLCVECHDTLKRQQEKRGWMDGVDAATGLPLDHAHPAWRDRT